MKNEKNKPAQPITHQQTQAKAKARAKKYLKSWQDHLKLIAASISL